MARQIPQSEPSEPARLRGLLNDVRVAPLWLLLRLFLGWSWLELGWRQLGASGGVGASDLQAIGLTLAGIALMLGALTAPAAFIGGCLSVAAWANESLPMTALHLAAVVWLILAWKTAGWIGLDRWLLPLLGMPWRSGVLFSQPNGVRNTGVEQRSSPAGQG